MWRSFFTNLKIFFLIPEESILEFWKKHPLFLLFLSIICSFFGHFYVFFSFFFAFLERKGKNNRNSWRKIFKKFLLKSSGKKITWRIFRNYWRFNFDFFTKNFGFFYRIFDPIFFGKKLTSKVKILTFWSSFSCKNYLLFFYPKIDKFTIQTKIETKF